MCLFYTLRYNVFNPPHQSKFRRVPWITLSSLSTTICGILNKTIYKGYFTGNIGDFLNIILLEGLTF